MTNTSNDTHTNLTRRSFLKLGGMTAAASAVAGSTLVGCDVAEQSPEVSSEISQEAGGRWSWETPPDPISDDKIVETIEKDFIIAGAGLAGVATACSLAENGGEVLVIEKGTTYAFRGGHYGSCNSRRWKEAGIEHDPADIARDWIAQCNSRCNERLVWTFLNRSGEALDWLADKVEDHGGTVRLLGVVYKGPTYREYEGTMMFIPSGAEQGNAFGGGIANDESQGITTSEMAIYSLREDALAAGAEFVYETTAQQLVMDGERVVGIIAQDADGYKKYVGRKAVILATGDISGDDEMCEAYSPLMLRCQVSQYVPQGVNTGDGQKMGMWIGAKLEDGPFSPMIHPQGYVRISHYFLMVDTRGERFMNEDVWSQGKSLSALIAPGNSDHAWSIFDSEWLNQIPETIDIGGGMFWVPSGWEYGTPWTPDADQGFLDQGLENGMVKQGNTVEELAAAIAEDEPQFDQETFIAEFNRYNELCENGRDTDFGKRSALLYKLANPPYYAAKFGPCRMTAPGGLLINTKSQVLNEEDNPIEGLYAVGNVSGGIYAVDYPLVIPGNSHGRCVTFGYLFGRQLTGIE